MNYSINDALTYIKANWKHLLTGIVTAYVAQHFGAPGSAKLGAILHIIGLN